METQLQHQGFAETVLSSGGLSVWSIINWFLSISTQWWTEKHSLIFYRVDGWKCVLHKFEIVKNQSVFFTHNLGWPSHCLENKTSCAFSIKYVCSFYGVCLELNTPLVSYRGTNVRSYFVVHRCAIKGCVFVAVNIYVNGHLSLLTSETQTPECLFSNILISHWNVTHFFMSCLATLMT